MTSSDPPKENTTIDETGVEELLQEILSDYENTLKQPIKTIKESGYLTTDKGVVIIFPWGQKFIIKIKEV